MTAIVILLAVIVVLTALAVGLLWRLTVKLNTAPPAAIAPEAAEPHKGGSGSVDEGFENIMQYSVKGKTGFEPGGMKL
jgi:hypothetical protein